MTYLKTLVALMALIPELMKLIKMLENKNKELQTARKVKDDIQAINKAFEEQDAEALNKIFSS